MSGKSNYSRQVEKQTHVKAATHIAHEHQVVRYTHNKKHYELLTNVGEAQKYRDGIIKDAESVLANENIWYNHSRDEKPSEDELAAQYVVYTFSSMTYNHCQH